MKLRKPLMIALVAFVLVTGVLSSISLPSLTNSPGNSHPQRIVQAGLSGDTRLGIDCALGSTIAVLNNTGFPVAPSEQNKAAAATQSSCTWIGDLALTAGGIGDGSLEPLVSDQDESQSLTSPAIGGGFTASVIVLQNNTALSDFINGFQLAVHWDPHILRAIAFDQTNETNWAPNILIQPVSTIDNVNGVAQLAQVINGEATGNFTLFRIRFDVVGVGTTSLHIDAPSGIGLTNPGNVVYQETDGSFDSETVFDPGHSVNWSASFTNSTPIIPGSPTTFQATVSGGIPAYTFSWQFNSCNQTGGTPCMFTSQATNNPVTVTLPTLALGIRIDLEINDSASPTPHSIHLVHSIAFALALRDYTTPNSQFLVNTPQTFANYWLGGIPPYTGTVRFCPGNNATSNVVCTAPKVTISDVTPTQTLSQGVTYKLAGVYTDTLTLKDSSLPSNQRTATLYANVTGSPQVYTVTVTTNPALPTLGQSVTVTAHIAYATGYPSGFEASSFVYNFTFGDGFAQNIPSGGTTVTATHSFSSSGNFTVRVIARENTPIRATSFIQEVGYGSASVFPAISGSFSLSSGASAQTGQAVTFNPSISGGTGSYTYSWNFGDGSSDTTANPSHTYSATGTYNVTLTITDSSGRTFASSQVVTVNPPSGSSPWLLYAIIGVVVLAAVVGVLMLRRRSSRVPSV